VQKDVRNAFPPHYTPMDIVKWAEMLSESSCSKICWHLD